MQEETETEDKKEKALMKYSKKIVALCCVNVTVFFAICLGLVYLQREVPEYFVRYFVVFFGGELLLSALIKIFGDARGKEKEKGDGDV